MNRLFSMTIVALFATACSASSSPSPEDATDARAPACARPEKGPYEDYTTNDLPSGACDGSVRECVMAARVLCPFPSDSAGPTNVYDCACTSNGWSCAIRDYGGSLCIERDGGDAEASD